MRRTGPAAIAAVLVVDDRDGDQDAHWLGTVEGGFANPLRVIESAAPVADLVGDAFGSALALRGMRGGEDAPFELDVTIERLGAVQYLRRRADISFRVVLRRRGDPRAIVDARIDATAASGSWIPFRSGLLAPSGPLRDLLARTLDAAVDRALDAPALRRALELPAATRPRLSRE